MFVQLAGGEDVLGKSDKGLHPHDIDAFWLQRKLSKHYDDPMLAQTRAGEVLSILKVYSAAVMLSLNAEIITACLVVFDVFVSLVEQHGGFFCTFRFKAFCNSWISSYLTDRQQSVCHAEMQ